MFMKTVLADGQAEQQVIREMKARAAGARGDIEQIVRGVMADVQQRGWDAVVEYAERFDGKAPYIVEPKVLDDAYNACDPKLIAALEKAAANIRDYHEQMLVKTWEWNRSKGETLGQTVRGLSRVGIYVPGGTAAYPSSVLMNAIPAKVAGVGELIMVTPPTENMSNEVLAAAKIAGVDTVIAIGGTQAIAALTYGAGFIPQVDKIVGPGNAFVAAAKKLAFGTVDLRCRRPAQSGRARQAGFRRPADRFHGTGTGHFVRDGAAGKAPPAVGHYQGERGELRLRHRVRRSEGRLQDG